MTGREVRQGVVHRAGNHPEHVNRIPPSDGQAVRTHQPRIGAVPEVLRRRQAR
jgi:hypothetical protein